MVDEPLPQNHFPLLLPPPPPIYLPTYLPTSPQVSAIKKAISEDMAAIRKNDHSRWNKTDPNDPYWEGKRMAMYTRIALIADEVGMDDEVGR